MRKIIIGGGVLFCFLVFGWICFNFGKDVAYYNERKMTFMLMVVGKGPTNLVKNGSSFWVDAYYKKLKSTSLKTRVIANLGGRTVSEPDIKKMAIKYSANLVEMGIEPPWKSSEEIESFIRNHVRYEKY